MTTIGDHDGPVLQRRRRGQGGINGVIIVRGGGFTDERLEQVIVNDAFARARGVPLLVGLEAPTSGDMPTGVPRMTTSRS